jgi:hypothetical protein
MDQLVSNGGCPGSRSRNRYLLPSGIYGMWSPPIIMTALTVDVDHYEAYLRACW